MPEPNEMQPNAGQHTDGAIPPEGPPSGAGEGKTQDAPPAQPETVSRQEYEAQQQELDRLRGMEAQIKEFEKAQEEAAEKARQEEYLKSQDQELQAIAGAIMEASNKGDAVAMAKILKTVADNASAPLRQHQEQLIQAAQSRAQMNHVMQIFKEDARCEHLRAAGYEGRFKRLVENGVPPNVVFDELTAQYEEDKKKAEQAGKGDKQRRITQAYGGVESPGGGTAPHASEKKINEDLKRLSANLVEFA